MSTHSPTRPAGRTRSVRVAGGRAPEKRARRTKSPSASTSPTSRPDGGVESPHAASEGTDVRTLLAVLEEERARLGALLHSQSGQHATILLLGLKEIEACVQGHPAAGKLRLLEETARRLAGEIHEVTLALCPPALREVGLVRCLAVLLEEEFSAGGIRVEFEHAELGAARLPIEIETNLYRILAEALRNVARHAAASRVAVILRRRQRDVLAIVEDDGVGLDLEAPPAGAPQRGIPCMRARVAALNGGITFEAAPGRGTTVIVRLPCTTTRSHG